MIKTYQFLTIVCLVLLTDQFAFAQKSINKQGNQSEKLFSFGVIADVQYANADKAGARDYRNSIYKLEKCISELNTHDLECIISLGDIIDHDYSSLDKPLSILEKSKAPVYHVIGNHEFSVEDKYKGDIRERLNNKRGYAAFKVENIDFIILDGSDISTFAHAEGSREYDLALAKYEGMKKRGINNATTWNGGISDKQFRWLKGRIEKAERRNRKVLLFCHWPLLPENGTQLWDNKKVLELINKYKAVIVWMSGHHHAGGYHKVGNIHHLTIKGMVEAQSETSFGIMDVYPDKLVLNGYGDQSDYILEMSK